MTDWSVLILGAGFKQEEKRAIVREALRGLGLRPIVYDDDYSPNPSVHSHEACLEAIRGHDIVVALLDGAEGGTLQRARLRPETVKQLVERNIIPADVAAIQPTILHTEVRVAKELGKPFIPLIPKSVESSTGTLVKQLRNGALALNSSRTDIVPVSASLLIQEGRWRELSESYTAETGLIESLRHLVFLEETRRVGPNFVLYYDESNLENLRDRLKSRIEQVFPLLLEGLQRNIQEQIAMKRPALSVWSLRDLATRGLILSPPFRGVSGDIDESSPLIADVDGSGGSLARSIQGGRSTLLVGDPGLGKTTVSLFTFRELVGSMSHVFGGVAPIFVRMKDLSADDVVSFVNEPSAALDNMLRTLVGRARGKRPWPQQLALPNERVALVLDSLEESGARREDLIQLLKSLSGKCVLAVSCRETDFERNFETVKHIFSCIVRLEPWSHIHVLRYADSLLAAGVVNASRFLKDELPDGHLSKFISMPLWLSMLTYLVERQSSAGLSQLDDHELVQECLNEVAKEELERVACDVTKPEELMDMWRRAAFDIHLSRRSGRSIRFRDLCSGLGIIERRQTEAFASLLDVIGDRVSGFIHEVFGEYLLADYISGVICDRTTETTKVLEALSYQRSQLTNKFLRAVLKQCPQERIESRLIESYFLADRLGDRSLFAKNQIAYLLGRVSSETDSGRSFLANLWVNEKNARFIRHSAAFGLVMAGDRQVEEEFYDLLVKDIDLDEVNRAYHLYYYGDIDLQEGEMPPRDDLSRAGDFTLGVLERRLRNRGVRHRNLRRIELLTLRRVIETRRRVPDWLDIESLLADVEADASTGHEFGFAFTTGIGHEVSAIRGMILSLR